MKLYVDPEIEVINFAVEDIITASGDAEPPMSGSEGGSCW